MSGRKSKPEHRKTFIIRLRLHEDDLETFRQAFVEGKLADLGILEILESPVSEKRWAKLEARRRTCSSEKIDRS